MRLLASLAALLVAACAGPSGDAERGKSLHASCLQCHGTELYVPPARKVASLEALRKEVEKWGDMYNPRRTEQEIEDLVAWLNRDFYRFRN
ncbi:MAG: hypothetical protein AB1452_07160 [Pseudomonadota bacterium]